MKSVIFIVHTEYHLLQSIGIIETYYKDSSFHPIIYRVSPSENGRIRKINKEKINAEYRSFVYNYRLPGKGVKEWLKKIIEIKPNILYIFNEDKFWMTFLLSKLSALSCKIILAPDGAKVYDDFRISTTEYLKKTFKNIFFSLRSGIPFPIPRTEKCYASNKYIDEVWVEFSDYYNNRTNKTIVEYSIEGWEKTRMVLNEVFMFDAKDVVKEPIILYIDSSIVNEDYYKRVIELLESLHRSYPKLPLYIKCHQVSERIAKEHYKSISNVHFFNSDVPAELIIASLNDSILVSLVSTSMLLNNPTCKYMWFYPCFQDFLDVKTLRNPTKHIKVYTSFDIYCDE